MMNKNVSIFGSVGVVYGLYYSMKNNKSLTETAIFALAFGLGGALIGNTINKLYEV
jgi:lipoprotein signal peptidase